MKNIIGTVLFSISALLLSAFAYTNRAAQQPPNIVIILMDDMGYGDLECYGGITYHTPNINKMAAGGMRFTNFYSAQAVCSASRAGLLTGCYPNRVGISGALFPWSEIALNPEEETIAEILKAKGYRTGMVGKWHLGQKEPFFPLNQGFDEFFGLPYSNDMWPVDYDGYTKVTDTTKIKSRFPPLFLMEGNKQVIAVKNLDDQEKLTTQYTQRAVQFIRASKGKPFFLYLAHSMPHVPIGASQFKGKSSGGRYGDVMEELDWSVGEILKTLDELKLADNTLVVVTSDNGPWLNFGNHAGSTGGLKEGKGTHWEGGQRVPCIVRWRGTVPAGTICNSIASNIDLLPTIASITAAHLPPRTIDGVNLLPLLKQEKGKEPRDEFVYYYDRNSLKAIRKGQWKLVFPCQYNSYKKAPAGHDGWPGEIVKDSTGLALYDLRADPGETKDVQNEFKPIVDSLKIIADRYRMELGDDLTGVKGKGVRMAGVVVVGDR